MSGAVPRRPLVVLLVAGALAGDPVATGPAAAVPRTPTVTVTPAAPQPGEIVLLRVAGGRAGLVAEWAGLPRPLFPVKGGLAALVGLDLDTPAGRVTWRLTEPGGVVVRTGFVTVRPRSFSTQHLTLPPGQVDLDAATLARAKAERAALDAATAESVGERLWRGPFRVPVDGGQPSGGFGLRRVINGQPRSPHAGYDWAAPVGTPVVAANAGRVALVAEHFFAGRLVVLDHGLGLFTLYFHLDEARVAAGERVLAGQPIGAVGATGRVTGPHLHLAVLLAGARVDPEALLAVRLPSGD